MSNEFPGSGDVAVAEPPVFEDNEETSSRRPAILLVALLGVVLIAAAAYFLFFSGSSEPEPQAQAPAAPVEEAPAEAAPAPEAVEPPVFNGAVGTDPFKPLIQEQEPAAAESTTGDAAAPGTTATGEAATATASLTVLQVADDGTSVSVSVDGQTFNGLTVGSPFGEFYKVYGIFAPACAGFLYGDQAVGGCEGDTITVSR